MTQQLEDEQNEKQALVRQKREMEVRMQEVGVVCCSSKLLNRSTLGK